MKNVVFFLVLITSMFFINAPVAFGEEIDLDSLKKVISTTTLDTTKINTLNVLSQKITSKKPEDGMKYAIQALSLAKKIKYKKGQADSYNNIGLSFRYQNSYKESVENFMISLKIRQEINSKEDISESLENLGNVYFHQGDYTKAIENYEKSYKICIEINNKKRASKASNNLGTVYSELSNYSEALTWIFKSLKIKEEIEKENPGDLQNKKGIGASYNNIANTQVHLGNLDQALGFYLKALEIRKELNDKKGLAETNNNLGNVYIQNKDYPKALEYYKQALTLKKEIGDKKGIPTTLTNIGTIYEKEKKFDEAIKYHLESLKLYEEVSDKNGCATAFFNIGNTYKLLKKHQESINSFNKSLELARELGLKRKIQECYEGLAEVHSAVNDYNKAYEYHKLYSDIKDSIFNDTKSNQIAELSTKYESEKKEKEIQLLTKQGELQDLQLNRNKILIYSFSAGFALILILSIVIYRGYAQKRAANDLLASQNKEISDQKHIIEEKNKDITDSIVYAKRIQEAILPPKAVLDNSLSEHFILFKPKDIVSGDFYWFNETISAESETPIKHIAAVDCTGHGVPGAFMSIIGHTALNQAVNEHGKTKPSEILEQVNKILSETLRNSQKETDVKDGMDIALCSIDTDQMLLQYSGAFNPLWLIREGIENSDLILEKRAISQLSGLAEIKADKQPVGSYVNEGFNSFTNHEIKLEKGDTFYMFSDGYCDQFGGEKGKKFMPKQLKELLLGIQDKPMKEQKNILNERIEQWRGSLEQIDDILVIGIRV